MALALNLGLKGLKYLLNRGKKNDTSAGAKPPISTTKKIRLGLALPTLITAIVVLLSVLAVFAGSNAGTLKDYDIFTLNVSRVGGELHEDINGAIKGINLDDLHTDLVKRSTPATVPVTTSAAPTTLVTIAPRSADVGSVFKSLTQDAGEGVDSAKSAARSRASSVRSKASSAANSVESSVNGGIDKMEQKIKDTFVGLVDDAFDNLIENLNLDGFYSFYVSNTCQGNYLDEDGKNITSGSGPVPEKGVEKHIDNCHKHSDVNPVGIVVGFYWIGAVLAAFALVLGLVAIWKPSTKWIGWTLLADIAAMFVIGTASAIVHGIAHGAEALINFIGNGVSIEGVAGAKFITLTWSITCLLLVNTLLLLAIRHHIKRHPLESATIMKLGSSDFGRPTISQPIARPDDAYAANTSIPMGPMGGYRHQNAGAPPAVPTPPAAYDRYATQRGNFI